MDINIAHTEKREMDMSIYPNPAQNNVNLNLDNMTEGNINIHILDMTGKIVRNIQQTVAQGYNVLVLDMALPTGLYFVKVLSSDKQSMACKLQIIE